MLKHKGHMMRLQLSYTDKDEYKEKFNEAFDKYIRMYDDVSICNASDPKTVAIYQVIYKYGLGIQKQFSRISSYDMVFIKRVNDQINCFI